MHLLVVILSLGLILGVAIWAFRGKLCGIEPFGGDGLRLMSAEDEKLPNEKLLQEEREQLLGRLPGDISQERRQVVDMALSLLGKVEYRWGGKTPEEGMDCSGFTSWVFASAYTGANTSTSVNTGASANTMASAKLGGKVDAGKALGAGVSQQRAECDDIAWDEAQPGDLAFYEDNSHVGIVVGRDDEGEVLVCHCSSGQGTVVVTEALRSGFAVAGRWQGMSGAIPDTVEGAVPEQGYLAGH